MGGCGLVYWCSRPVVTGLNGLAYLLNQFYWTRYFIGGHWSSAAIILSVLIPVIFVLGFGIELWTRRGSGRRYLRLRWFCYGIMLSGWLAIAPTGGIWAYVMLRSWEPWPLTLWHGPDTSSALAGFRANFAFDPPASVSNIYHHSYSMRDGVDYLRFDYTDWEAIEKIIAAMRLSKVPREELAQHPSRYRTRKSYGSWWTPELISAAGMVYSDGHGRTLWIDEALGRAYYEWFDS